MAVEAGRAPRILIVRRDNIGDLACTTPLIDALRVRHPAAWIGALVNTYNAEVLARNPALDEVFAYEKLKHRNGSLVANLLATLRLTAGLRARRVEHALVPAPSPQALRVVSWIRPERVVCADLAEAAGKQEVERTFALGASLGVAGRPGPMRVYPDPARIVELQERFSFERPPIAVHLSARRPAQRWPVERYAELISRLTKTSPVLLLWAPGSQNDPRHPGDDEKAAAVPAMENLFKLPTPDLATLIAALSLADRVICPDGGAMHLAAALGKPVVALFGDSEVERWRPWGVAHRVVQPASRDLASLELGPVLASLASLAQET